MSESKYVRTEQLGDALVVTPLFTFAAFAEPDLAGEWSQVQSLVESPAVKHVVVDLGAIPYFGSTVLEWMVQMWRPARRKRQGHNSCLHLLASRQSSPPQKCARILMPGANRPPGRFVQKVLRSVPAGRTAAAQWV